MKGSTIKELRVDMTLCLLFLKTFRRRRRQGHDLNFARKKFPSFEFAKALARIRESVSVLAVSLSLCIRNFHESFESL